MATTCADLHSFWRACVGVATAASPHGPWQLRPPALKPVLEAQEGETDAGGGEAENPRPESLFLAIDRPHVVRRHDLWHMFFSVGPENRNPGWKPGRAEAALGSNLFHYVAG